MSTDIRNLLLLAIVLVAALIGVPFLSALWFDAVIEGRTFTTSVMWFRPNYALQWLFHFLVFLGFGYVIGRYLPARNWWLSAALFGSLYGICDFALTSNHFVVDLTWSHCVWVYGTHVMPLVGAVSGAVLHWVLVRRKKHA